MAENFSYKRLEVISVLYKSWDEIDTKLRLKSGSIDRYSFCFIYAQKPPKTKGISNSIYTFPMFNCGYFIYTPKNIWLFYSRSNISSRSNMYEKAISLKIKFLTKLKEVIANFNTNETGNIFEKDTNKILKTPFKSTEILIYTIPAISTISAILEGTLREILAKYFQNEINYYVDQGIKEGRSKHNNYQKMLVAKQWNIESVSSFKKLLDEYSIIFELSISSLMDKEIINIINSLFTLRNIFAHGTSIVTTNRPVIDDDYFKNWNQRVNDLQKVLKKYFGSDDFYLNISDIRISSFYMGYTRIFLLKIIDFVANYDNSGQKTISNINFINTLKSERHLNYKYDEYFLKMF
ncbi:hypothetical protein ABFO79_06620 [Acinetobacter schindleri]|uniref:hypothetical protein n=1 Tax=Acinetobacter schindleri TaxID=108981 RepID=UPI0032122DA0